MSLAPNGRPVQQPFRLKMVELRNEPLALPYTVVTCLVTLGVRESKAVADTEIRIRGEAEKLGDQARASVQRSIDLPLLRGPTPISLEVFEFAEQGRVTVRRATTTVAAQALCLLNDTTRSSAASR